MKWTLRPPTDGLATFRRFLRKTRGLVGYIALAIVLFFVFVWVSLPTRAIAWRIGHEAKKRGYIVDVEDVSISPFGGVTLYNVTWTYAPSRSGQIPRSFFVDEVEADISLIRLLFGTIHVEVATHVDEGTITAMYEKSDEESAIKIDIDDLALFDVPKLQQAVNAPVRGTFGLHVDLRLPEGKFTQALGTIEFSCDRCRIGDGETLVFIPGVKKGLLTKGITLPEIDFGSLKGKLNVEDGAAKTEGIVTESDEFKLKILGQLLLRDPFSRSAFEFDIKVLLTEALQSESETLKLMVQTRSKNTYLEAPEEDWMGFKLRGTVSRPEFIGIKSKTRAERALESKEKARARARAKAAKAKKPTPKKKKPAAKKPDPKQEGEAEATARNTAEAEDSTAPATAVMDSTVNTATPSPDPSAAKPDEEEEKVEEEEEKGGDDEEKEEKDEKEDEGGSSGGDSTGGGGEGEGGGDGGGESTGESPT